MVAFFLFGEKLSTQKCKSADMCFYCRIENSKMRQNTFLRACRIFFFKTLKQEECSEECRVETKDRALFQDGTCGHLEDVSFILHGVDLEF